MDSLMRKACELGEKTAHCNVEVILSATLWMEKQRRSQGQDRGDDRPALFDARDQKRVPDQTPGHRRTYRACAALVEGGQR